MQDIAEMKDNATALGFYNTGRTMETLLHEAEEKQLGYREFLEVVLQGERNYRVRKARDRRIKEACFPYRKNLQDFNLASCEGLNQRQMTQLSELNWIDGIYNLILAGPPGVGKTHLAIGLGYKACEEGYRVSYTTMQQLMQFLRAEQTDKRSRVRMNRIRKSQLLIIDEVGYLPVTSTEGNLFFQLVSELQEMTSIVITTNKGFEQWTEFLGDVALATAILDRLSFHCDRINLHGKSYRMENHKSFLDQGTMPHN